MRRRILGEISTIPYMSLSACWISTIPAGTACPLNAHWVVRDDREISPCVRCPQLACGTYWIATFKKKIQFCLNITLIKKEVLCTFRLWLMQVKTNCWVNYRRYYYTVSNRGRGLKERSRGVRYICRYTRILLYITSQWHYFMSECMCCISKLIYTNIRMLINHELSQYYIWSAQIVNHLVRLSQYHFFAKFLSNWWNAISKTYFMTFKNSLIAYIFWTACGVL